MPTMIRVMAADCVPGTRDRRPRKEDVIRYRSVLDGGGASRWFSPGTLTGANGDEFFDDRAWIECAGYLGYEYEVRYLAPAYNPSEVRDDGISMLPNTSDPLYHIRQVQSQLESLRGENARLRREIHDASNRYGEAVRSGAIKVLAAVRMVEWVLVMAKIGYKSTLFVDDDSGKRFSLLELDLPKEEPWIPEYGGTSGEDDLPF